MNIQVKCESNIAENSLDHLHPCGTMLDHSENQLFNRKLYELFDGKSLKILDIGCSGGNFVMSCIRDGHLSIGLEGSDFSLRNKREAWGEIPEFLYTCDVTKNFRVVEIEHHEEHIVRFDVITAWEFFEHISEECIDKVIENIKLHLLKTGLVIISTTTESSPIDGIDLHVTKQPLEWWIGKFEEHGFKVLSHLIRHFGFQWIRGAFETKNNFHIVAGLEDKTFPQLTKFSRFINIINPNALGKLLFMFIRGKISLSEILHNI